jgi:DNA gyrase subunit A
VAIRSSVKEVRVAGRNTQGVKLVSLDSGDLVTAVARMVPDDEKDGEAVDGVEGAELEITGELDLG